MKSKKYPLTRKQANEIEKICNVKDWKRITENYVVSDMIPADLYKKAWYYGFEAGFKFAGKIKKP